jgi:glycosyltransferase involved in cell wall biosynthesis
MSLTVLSIAYPFAALGLATAGGAEQVLSRLDRALVEAGHTSLVVAREGSSAAGRLIPVAAAYDEIDDGVRRRVHAAVAAAAVREIARRPIDVVHLHGIDFDAYLPPAGPPVLVTLHLPVAWYAPEALRTGRPDTFLHCVSAAQQRDADGLPNLLPPIENGVDVDAFAGPPLTRRGYALMLARVCPEKGIHLALDAARLADVPLLVAGDVFPYAAHRRYFDEEIRPRLDARRRYLGPVGGARKGRLLQAARCLVVASTVAETSSLVAREALAAGTPVVALRRGALVDAIDHGRTGFLVDDLSEMAAAILRSEEIDPAVCRAEARRRFSDRDMVARYLDLYGALAARKLGSAA